MQDWEKIGGTKKVNRYRPQEVKAAIAALEVARERRQAAAGHAWSDFLGDVTSFYAPLRAAVAALASLDALQSLALVSCNLGYVAGLHRGGRSGQTLSMQQTLGCRYVRPEFVTDPEEPPQLVIKAGRHPVLDAMLDAPPVPNDTYLTGAGFSAIIITGPNMGGKSCYIRQAALIAIMAQVSLLGTLSCTE